MSDTSSDINNFDLEDLIGTLINGVYIVEDMIGMGGMGAVFRAMQIRENRQVAIKVISPKLVADLKDARRFLREARIGLMLSHPAIVKVHEFGEMPPGLLFMVMEYIEGESLAEYLDRNAPLLPAQCLVLLKPLCDALDYAHSRNILHRDLKPQNIIVAADEKWGVTSKLVDFGIMKLLQPDDHISFAPLTDTNVVLGTPDYMSPEQLMNHTLEPTADIYSAGVILYKMLTGKLPIEFFDFSELLMLKVYQDPAPPSRRFSFFPPSLDPLILKVLARDPEKRYQSASEFYQAFQDAVALL